MTVRLSAHIPLKQFTTKDINYKSHVIPISENNSNRCNYIISGVDAINNTLNIYDNNTSGFNTVTLPSSISYVFGGFTNWVSSDDNQSYLVSSNGSLQTSLEVDQISPEFNIRDLKIGGFPSRFSEINLSSGEVILCNGETITPDTENIVDVVPLNQLQYIDYTEDATVFAQSAFTINNAWGNGNSSVCNVSIKQDDISVLLMGDGISLYRRYKKTLNKTVNGTFVLTNSVVGSDDIFRACTDNAAFNPLVSDVQFGGTRTVYETSYSNSYTDTASTTPEKYQQFIRYNGVDLQIGNDNDLSINVIVNTNIPDDNGAFTVSISVDLGFMYEITSYNATVTDTFTRELVNTGFALPAIGDSSVTANQLPSKISDLQGALLDNFEYFGSCGGVAADFLGIFTAIGVPTTTSSAFSRDEDFTLTKRNVGIIDRKIRICKRDGNNYKNWYGIISNYTSSTSPLTGINYNNAPQTLTNSIDSSVGASYDRKIILTSLSVNIDEFKVLDNELFFNLSNGETRLTTVDLLTDIDPSGSLDPNFCHIIEFSNKFKIYKAKPINDSDKEMIGEIWEISKSGVVSNPRSIEKRKIFDAVPSSNDGFVLDNIHFI